MLSYTNFLNIMLETMSMTTQWGSKLKTQVDGYVGFDSVQEQLRVNALKRGFEFNIMVVGEFIINDVFTIFLLYFMIMLWYWFRFYKQVHA